VRTLVSAGGRPLDVASLSLGVLESDVGADGLDPLSRALTYSRLVGFDPRTSSVYADLAHEVEFMEPLRVRLRLREGQFFHPTATGEAHPVTAEAVVRDFRRRIAEDVFLFTKVVDQVEAPGDYDVVLRLRAPFSLLFEHLARVDASVRGAGDYGGIRARLGSGPFFPLRRDGDDVILSPSPLQSDDERPLVREVTVRRAAQSGDLDALFVQGQLDIREHPDTASRQLARGRTQRLELERPRQAMRGLALSLLGPGGQEGAATIAFRDQRVRRAISLALDRPALGLVDGGMLAGPVGPAFEGDALPLIELEAHPLYQRDVDEARALLAAAGQETLTFRLAHPDSPVMLQLVQRIVEQLGEVGVRARVVSRPQQEFQSALIAGEFEAALFDLDRLTSPDLGLRLHTTGGLDGLRSPWGYSNPVYDGKVRETLSQTDPALRVRHSRDAQRYLLEDVPAMLPLVTPLEYASVMPGVEGYEYGAYDFNATLLARYWQGPRPGGNDPV
jgi:peptide/nickel transport system substrate-binding protein